MGYFSVLKGQTLGLYPKNEKAVNPMGPLKTVTRQFFCRRLAARQVHRPGSSRRHEKRPDKEKLLHACRNLYRFLSYTTIGWFVKSGLPTRAVKKGAFAKTLRCRRGHPGKITVCPPYPAEALKDEAAVKTTAAGSCRFSGTDRPGFTACLYGPLRRRYNRPGFRAAPMRASAKRPSAALFPPPDNGSAA